MNKEILRKIISLFLSFAAALLFSLSAILLSATAALSEKSLLFVMNSTDFAKKAKTEISEELNARVVSGGLTDNFFENVISEDELFTDIKKAVSSAYDGSTFDSTAFSEKLRMRISEYEETANYNSATDRSDSEENITRFVNYLSSPYNDTVNSRIVRYAAKGYNLLSPTAYLAGAALIILTALLMFTVKRMNKTDFAYYRVSFSVGAALLILLLPLILILSGSIAKLNITSECMYSLTTGIIYTVFGNMTLLAVLNLLVTNIRKSKRQ